MPVANVSVLESPVVADLMMNDLSVVSQTTSTVAPIPVSMMLAALLKLVAVLKLILDDVTGVPSTVRMMVPAGKALIVSSVTVANEPERRNADTSAVLN